MRRRLAHVQTHLCAIVLPCAAPDHEVKFDEAFRGEVGAHSDGPRGAAGGGARGLGGGQAAEPVDLDVLFIGAHPDDEAFGLAVYGAWAEERGVRTGVVTITRGEGGGNAVGSGGGPAARPAARGGGAARGRPGRHRNVFYLDEVDFYYTVSAPLTREVWDDRDTLARVVRVVRATRPDMIVTMDPSPTPGNHGHHQLAARLAVEAYEAAADPSPSAADHGRGARAVARQAPVPQTARRASTATRRAGVRDDASRRRSRTDETFGLWARQRAAPRRDVGADRARGAARVRLAGLGRLPGRARRTRRRIGCDRFTQIAARVPYGAAQHGPRRDARGRARRGARAACRWAPSCAITPAASTSRRAETVALTVRARGPRRLGRGARAAATCRRGWTGAAAARARPARVRTATPRPRCASVSRRVRPGPRPDPRHAARGRPDGHAARRWCGSCPPVRGTLEPLPQVADFGAWTAAARVPQLDGLVNPVASLGVGRDAARCGSTCATPGRSANAGTVALRLPAGFAADALSKPFDAHPARRPRVGDLRRSRTPTRRCETSMQGGDYAFDIVTTADGAADDRAGGAQPRAGHHRPAGRRGAGGRRRRGRPGSTRGAPRSTCPACGRGTSPRRGGRVGQREARPGRADALYVLVDVTDDVLGTVLPAIRRQAPLADGLRRGRDRSARRRGEHLHDVQGRRLPDHPRGRPGGLPRRRQPPGPGRADRAGLRGRLARAPSPTAATRSSCGSRSPCCPPRCGPGRPGLNVFIYDSDTQDKTGQTRLGWSTWGGVQGDPYRWGRATLDGLHAAARVPAEPTSRCSRARRRCSVDSPQSIAQAARATASPWRAGRRPSDQISIGGGRGSWRGDALVVRLRAERPRDRARVRDRRGRARRSARRWSRSRAPGW